MQLAYGVFTCLTQLASDSSVIDSLDGISTTPLSSGATARVTAGPNPDRSYYLDLSSGAVADGVTVVQPLDRPGLGRWLEQAGGVGPQGPQGPQGGDGAQGPAGAQGADGAQGPQGVGAADELVKTAATDANNGFLLDKIVAGSNVTITVEELAPPSLLVQYFLNEAASGQGPTDALDAIATPLDLAYGYSAAPLQPVYFSASTGRGLRWTTDTSDGGPSAAVNATKVRTALNGSLTATLVVVANPVAVSASGSRFLHIGTGGSNGSLSMRATDIANARLSWNDTLSTFVNGLNAGRAVWHIIYDSANPTFTSRTRCYRNGVLQTPDGASQPALNEPLVIAATDELFIGNRSGGGRSLEGDIEYAAISAAAMTENQIQIEARKLLLSSDLDPTPPAGQILVVSA